jgi:hypothetical protein
MSRGTHQDVVSKRDNLLRLLVPVIAALFLARSLFLDGATRYNIISTVIEIVGIVIFWFISTKIRRPQQTYYLTGLGSLVVAALFIGTPASAGDPIVFGVIAWAAMTVLAAFWAVYYERTAVDGQD